MNYEVYIKDTETGEEAIWKSNSDWDDSSEYLWSDGSFACDCNRGDFFDKAAGRAGSENLCGDSRFVVTKIVSKGEIVYADDMEM